MKILRSLNPVCAQWIPLSFVLLAMLSISACYMGTDEIHASSVACDDDAFCVTETDGEYDHCGTELSKICCEKGTIKCGCRDDGQCNSELICFRVPADMNPSDAEAPYCYPDWMGDMQGWQRYE